MSYIDNITGQGLRILLLGSYDKETKNILNRLRKDLNQEYQNYFCFTILLINIDVFLARSSNYTIFQEFEENFKGNTTIIENGTKVIDTIEHNNEKEYLEKVGKNSGTIQWEKFRKITEFEKLKWLSNWADCIFLIKHTEFTRGGELIEVTYLLLSIKTTINNFDINKIGFFLNDKIKISAMLKELLDIQRVKSIQYESYERLKDKIVERIDNGIKRLNFLGNRFTQIESYWS